MTTLVLTSADGTTLRRVHGDARGACAGRRRRPARRARALPLLRGARPAPRRARRRRDRDRLVRPHRRRRQARRRVPVHGARGPDPARRRSRPTSPPRPPGCGRPRAARARSIFTVGFCFGGRHSWLAAAAGHGLKGAVGFYGTPGNRNNHPGPIQLASKIEAPILALQAGDDDHITEADNDGLRPRAHEGRRRARDRHLPAARRTASSTVARPSTRPPPTTPGRASATSSRSTPEPRSVSSRSRAARHARDRRGPWAPPTPPGGRAR